MATFIGLIMNSKCQQTLIITVINYVIYVINCILIVFIFLHLLFDGYWG